MEDFCWSVHIRQAVLRAIPCCFAHMFNFMVILYYNWPLILQQIATLSQKSLIIQTNGERRTFHCQIKIIGDPSNPLSIDVEHDALVKLQKVLRAQKKELSLSELKTAIEPKLRASGKKIVLEV
jgi:hypothetical protein